MSYIVGWHRWILVWGNLVHDTTTTMPGPCSEKSASPQEGTGNWASRRGEHMGRLGFDARSFFPWDGRSLVSHPTCDVPFPARRTGEYWKKMISARPLYREIGLGSRNLERAGR